MLNVSMSRMLKGLVHEIRPLPVIAALTAVYTAFLLAGISYNSAVVLFLLDVFLVLYTVHLLDTYEDYFIRKEDEHKKFTFAHGGSGLLGKNTLIVGAVLSSIGFLIVTIYLSVAAGPVFFLLSLSAWLIGVTYSKYLSKSIPFAMIAHPVGVFLAMLAAYYLQELVIDMKILAFSVPIFFLFLASRAWLDLADVNTDRRSEKPSFAIKLGLSTAKGLAFVFLLVGLFLSLVNSFSSMSVVGILIVLVPSYYGFRKDPKIGVHYVLGGVYLFILIQAALLLLK